MLFGYQLNKVSIRSRVDVVGANQSSSGHISLIFFKFKHACMKNMITGKYKCLDGDSDPSIPIPNPSARFCSMRPKKNFYVYFLPFNDSFHCELHQYVVCSR